MVTEMVLYLGHIDNINATKKADQSPLSLHSRQDHTALVGSGARAPPSQYNDIASALSVTIKIQWFIRNKILWPLLYLPRFLCMLKDISCTGDIQWKGEMSGTTRRLFRHCWILVPLLAVIKENNTKFACCTFFNLQHSFLWQWLPMLCHSIWQHFLILGHFHLTTFLNSTIFVWCGFLAQDKNKQKIMISKIAIIPKTR